jgi:hypothetical protein
MSNNIQPAGFHPVSTVYTLPNGRQTDNYQLWLEAKAQHEADDSFNEAAQAKWSAKSQDQKQAFSQPEKVHVAEIPMAPISQAAPVVRDTNVKVDFLTGAPRVEMGW